MCPDNVRARVCVFMLTWRYAEREKKNQIQTSVSLILWSDSGLYVTLLNVLPSL